MIDVANVRNMATLAVGRSRLFLGKYSPEIFLGLGIAGFVASEVLVGFETVKFEELRKETKRRVKHANAVLESGGTKEVPYDQEDYDLDMKRIKVQFGLKTLKIYAPAMITTALSIACLVGSHRIMGSRNIALMGAYKALDTAYKKYRERVVEKLGPEEEANLRKPQVRQIDVIEKDAEGKELKKTSIRPCEYADQFDPHSRMFDPASPYWTPSAIDNQFFLNFHRDHAQRMLRSRGYLFLNEVYEALGMDPSPDGQIMGWIYDPVNGYDGEVSFGLTDPVNAAFVEGKENCALLQFNDNGMMYDKLK